MSQETFLTYQKFNDQAAASELAQFFGENGLAYELEDSSINFDVSFAYSELNKEFRVKLRSTDFKRADELLQELSQKSIELADESHYLYQFSDEELMGILQKPDEWNAFDIVLAQHILQERGKEVSKEALAQLRSERLSYLREPEQASRFWIFAGYFCAILGGGLGMFIGWHLIYHKRTLPNGESVFAYTSNDRKDGNIIFVISIISVILVIAYKVLRHDS
ncbi:hypothetical protein VRU48_14305 [Pedobacter sp. KR3-3]|uniref:DUF2007 domain-containing protein n=1 Tax=Pedobacter albus TaxID=3113905 RepID=A0ABU7I9X4_9SPHI|nr:hypothetical protein [Pedobacter sp. KR3-3]MEE1946293.1 hypothetical protein [Pedobacter sp. KR3-3]